MFWNRKRTQKQITWTAPGGEYDILANKVLEAEHTLIAGTTGCGKTTFLRSVIQAALVKEAPSEVRFILIDPKRFEMKAYKHLPHVLRYANNEQDIADALRQAVTIMEARADMIDRGGSSCDFCDIYVVVDELNDLMICSFAREMKHNIQRIITLGRAMKVHMVCCTQNPNRATIPANIVSCYTCRIGLHCLSAIESRQIVGIKGCETLPKHGEAIAIFDGEIGRYVLPYIPEHGIDDLINYWIAQAA